MKKQNTLLILTLLITLSVGCNTKKEKKNSIISIPGIDRTLSELESNGYTGCMTTGLDKIGTQATGTAHSWKQSYVLDNAGDLQFTTTVYKDGTCTAAAYEITQIGTIAVEGASASVADGTNVTFTLIQTQYSPADNAWRILINSACDGSDVAATGNVSEWSGRGCQVGGSFNLINFQSVGSVSKNTIVIDANASTSNIYRDTTSHLGFYSFGSTSYPTSAAMEYTTY